jgi:hypothetical protein
LGATNVSFKLNFTIFNQLSSKGFLELDYSLTSPLLIIKDTSTCSVRIQRTNSIWDTIKCTISRSTQKIQITHTNSLRFYTGSTAELTLLNLDQRKDNLTIQGFSLNSYSFLDSLNTFSLSDTL